MLLNEHADHVSLFSLDPQEYNENRTQAGECCPERNLLAAVLLRAVQDYAQPHVIKGKNGGTVTREDARRAEEWIESHDSVDRPFSFLWVCWHLDLDPDAVRPALRNLKARCAHLPPMNNATFFSRLGACG